MQTNAGGRLLKLFISYAREDQERAALLVELLRNAGHQPWFDQALLPGQTWQTELGAAIRSNDAFVYLLSAASVASDWCRWEFNTAIECQKPIIPVLLEHGLDLPDPLGRYHCADFTGSLETQEALALATARLIGGLDQIAVVIPPAERSASGPEPAGMPTRSNFIERAAYDPVNKTLAIQFRSGEIYRYLDVPARVYQTLERAPSRGAYFHEFIRDAYRYHRDDHL